MPRRPNWTRCLSATIVAAPLAAIAAEPCPLADSAVSFNQPPAAESPPQDLPSEPGADTEQIFDRAEQRADQLDASDQQPRARNDRRRGTASEHHQDHLAGDDLPGRNAADADAQGRSPSLPPGFDNLELTGDEKAKMLRVIEQYDRQIAGVLDRFTDLHARAIGIEAIPLAATMRESGDLELADTPQRGQQRTAGFRPGDAPPQAGDEQAQPSERAAGDEPAAKIRELGQDSPFAGPAGEAWRKLHELHLEAVKLEAQKLVAIERLLPPEKLKQLHEFRDAQRAEDSGQPAGTDQTPERPDLQNADKNPEEERRDQERDRAEGAQGADAQQPADPNRSTEPLPERRAPGED